MLKLPFQHTIPVLLPVEYFLLQADPQVQASYTRKPELRHGSFSHLERYIAIPKKIAIRF